MTAFASSNELAEEWRPLSTMEHSKATKLLAAASSIIRSKRPELADDDADAKTVVLDVVRGAMEHHGARGLSTFSKTVGPRTQAGSLVNATGDLQWLRWHCDLLGISFGTMPLGSFGDCDRGRRGHLR